VKQSETVLKMKIVTADIENASDLVQDICAHFNLTQLDSECNFPRLTTNIANICEMIETNNTLKTHFAANISENINNLKA
jgi:RNA-binding protein YhbY